jgi:DNA-binding NarL/FixJ family response regulator
VSGPTVLVVDDEPEALEGIRLALFRDPFTLITAQSAAEALTILDETLVDVVVSDERMPDVEGSELLAKIRVEYPTIVRVLLTGHATVSSAVRAINDGAVFRYLLKPTSAEELSATIQEALRMKVAQELKDQVIDGARRQYDALAGLATIEQVQHSVRPPVSTPVPSSSVPPSRLSAEARRQWERLSPREQEIVRALRRGMNTKDIARWIDVSVHTVRNHLKAIYRKLDVHSQLEVVSRFSMAE